MKARRGLEVAGAAFLSAAAFATSAPGAQAAEQPNPNNNGANRLARRYVKHIGGRMLHIMQRNSHGGLKLGSSFAPSGYVELSLSLDGGTSEVEGSDGSYTLEAFADKVGKNGLDAGDINNVRVAEGSSPSDGRPLFALRMFTPHPHGGGINEGGARGWYDMEGTAVLRSGDRVDFAGSTDPSPLNTPPGLVLDAAEVRAAGHTMDTIIDDAVSHEPTHLEYPPFGPLQR